MFAGLINSAKSAVSALLLQYVARASVAIPFVIAAGFALAACTMMLVERFGQITAYWLVAGGLAVVGVVAAASRVGQGGNRGGGRAGRRGERHWRGRKRCGGASDGAGPIAALGALFSIPGGTAAALGGARLLARNWPLAILVGLIGLLYWPSQPEHSERADSGEGESVPPQPNGRADVHELRPGL